MLRTIETLDVVDKRVIVRVDFNVEVEGGRVVDDFRLRAAMETIRELSDRGSRAIVLLSHLGRPKGRDRRWSLRPVAEHFSAILGEPVRFVESCTGAAAEEASRQARGGAVLLFENLRFHAGEQANDPAFAEQLARLGDCYVNDAFGASHRAHASIVGIPAFLPSAAGRLLQQEVTTLTELRDHPVQPFLAVLGGAKISDKLPLIEQFLPRVSALCVGGALANTLLKARGISVGSSTVEEDMVTKLPRALLYDAKMQLPEDAVVSSDADGNAPVSICAVEDIAEGERILDIGPKTAERFAASVQGARTVFWNGPMGRAEVHAFRAGTEAVARAIAFSGAFSVVGGGDTTRYPFELGLAERIGFISTGGGAMLEFLAGKSLPGISVLQQK